jgi:GNAT superfamily N-acetyltransferase
MTQVWEPTVSDRPAVVGLLADSFRDDPFFRWIYPGDDYLERATEYFGLVCERLWPRARVLAVGALDAATVWIPPGTPVALEEDLAELAALLTDQLGDRAGDVLRAIASTAPYVPAEPHATCVYVAVREAHRGQGLGGAVMAPLSADLGREGAGTYLTSTNPRGLSFYRRLGFTGLAELSVFPNGPVLRPMLRIPDAS